MEWSQFIEPRPKKGLNRRIHNFSYLVFVWGHTSVCVLRNPSVWDWEKHMYCLILNSGLLCAKQASYSLYCFSSPYMFIFTCFLFCWCCSVVWGFCLAVLGAYSWLWDLGSLLVILGRPHEVPGINPVCGMQDKCPTHCTINNDKIHIVHDRTL